MTLKKLFAAALIALPLSLSAQEGPTLTRNVYYRGFEDVHTFRIPALTQTKKGTILAFSEARMKKGGDTGDIDLVVRRSEDGGKTWGPLITIWNDGDNVCGNPAPVVDRKTGRIILLSTWNNGQDTEPEIETYRSVDTRKVFVIFSDDDGLTWSEPREITSSVKLPNWTWYATGPCHATQLCKGPHRGRLVVSCNHTLGDIKDENGKILRKSESHAIYSDDCGETWHLGGCAGNGNESTLAETADGDLILNIRGTRAKNRMEMGACRQLAVSKDGGETFAKSYYEKQLIEPVCNGSMTNLYRKGKLTRTLLFSNPDHKTERQWMSIKQSDDCGKTWRTAYRVSNEAAAYSDIITLQNGDVALLYETGDDGFAYERITFVILPRELFRK